MIRPKICNFFVRVVPTHPLLLSTQCLKHKAK
ncbi:hypothetical protein Taro_017974 [Colocasia esculenta]|uniref:Uncharacterized protein n=1 Tax=Colocasia esculenta TaxID=4460 RepID=A0A843UUV3_COLES|nr:hypothetical protein [Colocasia esculenta]